MINELFNIITNNNNNNRTAEQRLADDVCDRMDKYEDDKHQEMLPSIIGLYWHWMLSLLGFTEALTKATVLAAILLTLFTWIGLLIL